MDFKLPSVNFGIKVLVVLVIVVLAAKYIPGASSLKQYFGLS